MQQKWYQKSWGIILLLLSLLILFTSCSQQNNTEIKKNETQEVSKKKAATFQIVTNTKRCELNTERFELSRFLTADRSSRLSPNLNTAP